MEIAVGLLIGVAAILYGAAMGLRAVWLLIAPSRGGGGPRSASWTHRAIDIADSAPESLVAPRRDWSKLSSYAD